MPRDKLDISSTQVNLFTKDKEFMIKHYGYGWTEKVRELVVDHCARLRRMIPPKTWTEYYDD